MERLILQNLMLASGQKIMPEKTLIIFDEVQDCSAAWRSWRQLLLARAIACTASRSLKKFKELFPDQVKRLLTMTLS